MPEVPGRQPMRPIRCCWCRIIRCSASGHYRRHHHRQSPPSDAVIGGQIGCDYQFSPNWVVGIEGGASGSSLKGSTVVPFQPAVANPGEAPS